MREAVLMSIPPQAAVVEVDSSVRRRESNRQLASLMSELDTEEGLGRVVRRPTLNALALDHDAKETAIFLRVIAAVKREYVPSLKQVVAGISALGSMR